jgi:CO/xanthine dehydrogenase Mo-binding subunit
VVEQPVLAKGKVCYVGQAVAVVVARDRYQARDALESILVDYEPLTPVLDPMTALRDDASVIHQEIGTNLGLRVSQPEGWQPTTRPARTC